jgi:hypothetical protein
MMTSLEEKITNLTKRKWHSKKQKEY